MGKKKTPAAGKKPAGKAAKPAGRKPGRKKPAAGAAAPAHKTVPLRKVRKVYEKYKPLLLALPGVAAVTYGVKLTKAAGYLFEAGVDGRPVFAVIVHVKAKKAGLAPGGKGFIPLELDGVPTDVIVAEPPPVVRAHAGQFGGGDGIVLKGSGGPDVRGTLGAVAVDTATGDLYALTCAHVAFGSNLAVPAGARIDLLPAGGRIGVPERNGFDPPFSSVNGPVDAAAVLLDPGTQPVPGRISPHAGTVSAAGIDQITTADVEIFGEGSKATVTGRIIRIGERVTVELAPGLTRTLDGVVRIQQSAGTFGVAADSGSVLVGQVGSIPAAVGLYFGTDPAGNGFALVLEDVLASLQLQLA